MPGLLKLLFAVAAALAIQGGVEQNHSADPTGRIAFYSDRDGNYEIYSILPDGTGPQRLTYDDAPDQAPAWSPDGSRIALTRTGRGLPTVGGSRSHAKPRATGRSSSSFLSRLRANIRPTMP